ncbi:MAG: restriction endonuclease subunit S [Actinomycetota bacterium]|nr:restriction endonuclease subunit S [Actinomycetota bacterium]
MWFSPEDRRQLVLKPGDLLVSEGGDVGRSCLWANELDPCGFQNSVNRVRPQSGNSSRFLYYWMSMLKDKGYIDILCNKSTIAHFTAEKVAAVPVPYPTVVEQWQIAAFLDRATAKIDTLIGEQQRLIELLKEKRQAIVSHAVTKGLNPDAPMKPSGVEWFGEVPAHWRVRKMKWVAEMESGHTPDNKIPAYWENCEIPWVSLNDTAYLKDHDYISETAYYINELGIANSSARLLPARAVVFSRDATIGRCAITTRPMAVSQHFIAWICSDSILPEYLLLRLRSMTQELNRLTTGATLKTIGMPDVRTLVTPLPPVAEQAAIVKQLGASTMALDALTAEAESAIALLQERRIALVSAAVTGKIDGRGLADAAEAA